MGYNVILARNISWVNIKMTHIKKKISFHAWHEIPKNI